MTILERERRLLNKPLGWTPRMLLVLAALLIVPVLLLPLWRLTMYAPQYSDGLTLDIFTHALSGGRGGQDVREINVLNHYIGMRALAEEDFAEFKWMPFVLGGLGLLLLRAAVLGTVSHAIDVLALFVYFAAFSVGSFGYKLYQYGHNLAPSAPVHVPPFTPPMFGYKKLANFDVYSYPAAGTYCMIAVAIALLAAVIIAARTKTETVQ